LISSSRYRIIAAGLPRVTAQNPFKTHPGPFHGTVFFYGFKRVSGACRIIPASGKEKRLNNKAIGIYSGDKKTPQDLLYKFFKLQAKGLLF
jgi:hypothetical protein